VNAASLRALLALLVAVAGAAVAAGCGPHDGGPPSSAEQVVALLPDPPEGSTVTWQNWAGQFVVDYCAHCHGPAAPCGGSGCHSAGDPALFDLHDQSAFVAHAAKIKCGIAAQQDPSWGCDVSPKTYPLTNSTGNNPLPTDEERGIIVAWIDAGCP
jgi:hypothetical protein